MGPLLAPQSTQPITRSQFLAAVKTRLILADLAAKGALDDPDGDPALPQLRLDEKRAELLRAVLQQMFPQGAPANKLAVPPEATGGALPPLATASGAVSGVVNAARQPTVVMSFEVEEAPPDGAKVASAKVPWTRAAGQELGGWG